MDIKRLQYFLTVAEERQITKAAERLHMAQPPLSKQLKLLENELGISLFKRGGSRKIKLTEAGHLLQNRAEQILSLVAQTEKEINDLVKGNKGTLTIGIMTVWSATLGMTLLMERIRQFHERYPNINFHLREGSPAKIEEFLHNGVIEIAITLSPADSALYETVPLPGESITAAFGPGFDLTPDDHISLAGLADKPLIIYGAYEEILLGYFRERGFTPRIICRHEDIRSMLLWANTGLGVAIVHESAACLMPGSNLVFKKIIEPQLSIKPIAITWMRNRYLSSAARHFINML
ncbi:transcription regulator hth lysr [Lucifera butyrica]|uniref:Transcription regulator hth lysr n=1 Tax=Lucifera butyrica TaxID=1351585 RepID=A0A498REC5_9FIRM|nr:LysR family transcriptional regulator [Lucifera butyrica]VBB09287.1 transcription regulator hth lysr [Lucifera butyrica]